MSMKNSTDTIWNLTSGAHIVSYRIITRGLFLGEVRKIGREADYSSYLFEGKEMLELYLHFRTNLCLENCALLDC
jgi:hypothetical protein